MWFCGDKFCKRRVCWSCFGDQSLFINDRLSICITVLDQRWYEVVDNRTVGNIEYSDITNFSFYFNVAANVAKPVPDPECDNWNAVQYIIHCYLIHFDWRRPFRSIAFRLGDGRTDWRSDIVRTSDPPDSQMRAALMMISFPLTLELLRIRQRRYWLYRRLVSPSCAHYVSLPLSVWKKGEIQHGSMLETTRWCFGAHLVVYRR